MPQAASVNDDHANELQQTGQKFHRTQGNKRSAAGQPSFFHQFFLLPCPANSVIMTRNVFSN
jgi:hypothetical protein